jgi:AcrR family transcriptional regulator
VVPRLWTETIQAHRHQVRDAIVDTTAALVAEHGLLSVTMSQIAEEAGIGRATLYKYFPDVEAILLAWHERQIAGHLQQLAEVRDQAGDAGERLEAVLEAYALISQESHGHHDTQLVALLHRGEQVARARQQLRDMLRALLTEAAEAGARSGTTSRPTSSPATASTPWRQPAACPPRLRSAGSSRSFWLGCTPAPALTRDDPTASSTGCHLNQVGVGACGPRCSRCWALAVAIWGCIP